jgi:MoaA/NifB/PqqE/SkfB family radical SAM enzyme
MGHSLRGLFLAGDAQEAKELYEELIKTLEREDARLRVLILDPSYENQQMYEVFEAQSRSSEEKSRRVLPLYGPDRELFEKEENKGDIYLTLEKLKGLFQEGKFSRSAIEVRVTRRIMYANVNRFGDRMIISPYKQEGLYLESPAFVVENRDAPMFRAYEKEFEDIWNDFDETRLAIYAREPKNEKKNPVEALIPRSKSAFAKAVVPSFNYEEFLLGHANRIERWFKKDMTPPFEVEFQPSSLCQFQCNHCIGTAITGRLPETGVQSLNECRWQSVFDLESDGFKIERIRISGLCGEPLNIPMRDFTFQVLEAANIADRETVLFTNGEALCDPSVRSHLVEVAPDWLHISLDACDPATFATIKGCDGEKYNEICNAIKEFCSNTNKQKKTTQTVVGYVVTQTNAHTLRLALDNQQNLAHGANFIRFKPDIRGPFGISWRDWRETKELILLRQQSGTSPQIFLTDVPWHHCLATIANNCWSQFFYATVGPDGNVFPCDHLTTSSKAVIGNLFKTDFGDIWSHLWEKGNIGEICSDCIVCSPFSSRLNHFVENLHVLFRGNSLVGDWQPIRRWIEKLSARPDIVAPD